MCQAPPPATRASAFTSILAPFIGEDFADGIPQSEAGIGPQAIVELADGSFLVSGGANRGSLYKIASTGTLGATAADHPERAHHHHGARPVG